VTAFENEGPRRDFLQSLPKGYAWDDPKVTDIG
jgi:hypothetical protein